MIIVFGSINMDMMLPVGQFPQPGETVLSPGSETYAGGKGANQALAAARAGAKTALVGKVGDDGMGLRILNGLRRDGVMTSGVAVSEEKATGLAVVITNQEGENEIIVATGANGEVSHEQVPDEILTPKNFLLLQMETSPQENWAILERAEKGGTTTMLNLAPAITIPQAALEKLDYLVVNQIEARQIAAKLGIDAEKNMELIAHALARQGNLTCIVTLGGQGSVAVMPDGNFIRVPALIIEEMIDRTGAGDAYCGTLAGWLHEGKTLGNAMRYASVAGSLACKARGAQPSYAYTGDIEEYLVTLGENVMGKI
ncbi:MAG TPA: ribokinase [Alphaproteobacteria bacterium]